MKIYLWKHNFINIDCSGLNISSKEVADLHIICITSNTVVDEDFIWVNYNAKNIIVIVDDFRNTNKIPASLNFQALYNTKKIEEFKNLIEILSDF